MIKKLVSNALLSMVMDKKAREKFTAAQEMKRKQQGGDAVTPAPSPTAASPAPKGAPTTAAKAIERTPAPKAAIRAEPRTRPPVDGSDDDAALIREALESAELELISKRQKKTMTPERQALIEQAMAIHRSKSHVLDELDPEHRDKLTFMALKALDRDFGE